MRRNKTPGVKWQCAVYCRRFAHNVEGRAAHGQDHLHLWPHDLSDAYGRFAPRETVNEAYDDLTKLKMGSMQTASTFSPFCALVVEVPAPKTIFRQMVFAIDADNVPLVELDKRKLPK